MASLWRRTSLRLAKLVVVAFAATLWTAPAPAQEKLGNSLDFVPADVAVYSSSLRLKEQFDIAANSRAWKKFSELPFVKLYLDQARMAMNSPQMAMAGSGLDFAADLVSNEIFFYASDETLALFQLITELSQSLQQQLQTAAGGNRVGGPDPDAIIRMVLRSLAARADQLKAPEAVVGFKVSNANQAKVQVNSLEQVLPLLQLYVPQLNGKVKREKAGEGDFITISLSGELIPAAQLDLRRFEEKPGEFDALTKKLRSMTLAISIGVWGDNFLISFGPSNEHLAALGQGPLLRDVPEMKPVIARSKERVVGMSYVSKAASAQFSYSTQSFDSLIDSIKSAMPQADLPKELEDRLNRDLQALGDDIKKSMPVPGAQAAVSYLTPEGYESYAYNYTQSNLLDGSKPLDISRHVGGYPLIAFAGRSKYDPADYAMLVKWLKVAYGYFEDLGLPQMSERERKEYLQVYELAKPLIARLDKATGEMLLPALADGQTALAIDAKITSQRWHPEMPPSKAPLPMLEMAVVVGVKDYDLLKKAVQEYSAIVKDALALARKINPNAPVELPPLQSDVKEVAGGRLHSIRLPAEAQLDPQIAPTAGATHEVAVLSTSPSQAERILTPVPLAAKGILADASRPRAAMSIIDIEQLIDVLSPWVDYGGGIAMAQQNLPAATSDQILGQVREVLQLLKAFRTMQSETYAEGDALVTHSQTIVRDVD